MAQAPGVAVSQLGTPCGLVNGLSQQLCTLVKANGIAPSTVGDLCVSCRCHTLYLGSKHRRTLYRSNTKYHTTWIPRISYLNEELAKTMFIALYLLSILAGIAFGHPVATDHQNEALAVTSFHYVDRENGGGTSPIGLFGCANPQWSGGCTL